MNRMHLSALISLLIFALPAGASGSGPSPRQMAHCMLARMKADQRESYREAFKTCKQSLDPQSREAAPTAMNSEAGAVHPKQ